MLGTEGLVEQSCFMIIGSEKRPAAAALTNEKREHPIMIK
jgi:hypothetical protein